MKFLVPFVFISLFLWTDFALSKQIKYSDLNGIVISQNELIKALDIQVQSKEVLTGYLERSFIPSLDIKAGHETFQSDSLGNHESNFYGIEAKLNLFNGMSDYWKDQSRNYRLRLAKVKRKISYNDILLKAQKSFLILAKTKLVLASYQEGLKKLNSVKRKAATKVSAGVIAQSDLTSINLIKIGFENEIESLKRDLNTEIASLSLILNTDTLQIEDIDESSIEGELQPLVITGETLTLNSAQRNSQILINSSQSKALRGRRLPKVDIFAKYGREPFSEREFVNGSSRDEWQAGVELSWNVGDYFEMTNEAQSLDLKSTAIKKQSEYTKKQFDKKIAMETHNIESIIRTVKNLSREIKLSGNYYSQVSSEYLRGIKSTSDLTTAFNQIILLKERRLDLIVNYHMTKAEIVRRLKK